MICQRCHEREAQIHVKRILNGKREDLYLCENCAEEMNAGFANSPMAGSHLLWNDLLDSMLPGSPLFGLPFEYEERRPVTRGLVCPSCGETEAELRKTGLLGCRHCYETFAQLLKPVFQKAHGHTHHVGHDMKKGRFFSESIGKNGLYRPEDVVENSSRKNDGADVDRQTLSTERSFRFVHAGEVDKTGVQGRKVEDDSEVTTISPEIARLRASLQEAVRTENYELAAKLRDSIHALESPSKDKESGTEMHHNDFSPGNGETSDEQ